MKEKANINVAVIGTIGVGKTTFIHELSSHINPAGTRKLFLVGEPSVSLIDCNKLLQRLYGRNMRDWVYPLQATISAAHEASFQEARESDYDISLFDMPYSSYIYNRIHNKHGRISDEEVKNIDNISRPFKFDIIVCLNADYETTVSRVKARNQNIRVDSNSDQKIEDYEYLKEHISDFSLFKEEWIKKYFGDALRIDVTLPDHFLQEYRVCVKKICEQIESEMYRRMISEKGE